MQRVTISIDETLAATFDRSIAAHGYQSRSEAVRDLVREAVETWRDEPATAAACVANLSYIYDRRVRSLTQRLAEFRHAEHDLVAATMQLPLDHEHTLETVMLRGSAQAVRAFSDRVRAERGVRFAAVNLIGVDPGDTHAEPDAHHHHHGHAHLSPLPG